MKRPLGLIGLTYLFTLAVVFYCYSFVLVGFVFALPLLPQRLSLLLLDFSKEKALFIFR